jgi:hypothetical protein
MLELLGNLGDFIGGIAVVVTLGYLAVQIRSQTIANRRSTFQDLLNHQAQLNIAWMTNSELGDALIGNRDQKLEDMDQKARSLVGTHATMSFRHGQNAYSQFLEKAITKEQLNQLKMPLHGLMGAPYAQQVWDYLKHEFPEEFQIYIDEEVMPVAQAVAQQEHVEQALSV